MRYDLAAGIDSLLTVDTWRVPRGEPVDLPRAREQLFPRPVRPPSGEADPARMHDVPKGVLDDRVVLRVAVPLAGVCGLHDAPELAACDRIVTEVELVFHPSPVERPLNADRPDHFHVVRPHIPNVDQQIAVCLGKMAAGPDTADDSHLVQNVVVHQGAVGAKTPPLPCYLDPITVAGLKDVVPSVLLTPHKRPVSHGLAVGVQDLGGVEGTGHLQAARARGALTAAGEFDTVD